MSLQMPHLSESEIPDAISLAVLSSTLKQKLKCSLSFDISILYLKKEDIPTILQLTPPEQFNRGLYDLPIVLKLEPHCFYTLVRNDTNEIIGTLMILNTSPETAVMGFYFIKPEYRKLGIAIAFFKTILPLYNLKNICNNAVESMKDKYNIFFPVISDWNINVYRGKLKCQNLNIKTLDNILIMPFSDSLLTKVVKYDAQLSSYSRKNYISAWLLDSHSATIVALQNGLVCGYGVMRQGQLTTKICPLIADSLYIAKKILASIKTTYFPNKDIQVSIQCSDRNKDAMELIQDHELTHVETVIKMFTKSTINIKLEKIYSFTSLDVSLY